MASTFPADDPAGAELARAIDRLARWDRVADTASVETTWFTLWSSDGWRSAPTHPHGWPRWPTRCGSGGDEWGTAEVAWGRINRHQRPLPGEPARALDPRRPSLPVGGAIGGFGSVFSYYSAPVDGPAGPRIGLAGNSFVKVIEFGPTPTARSVLNYGQSGDAGSRHFFDQAELYVRRAFKPAWFTRAEVEGNAVRSYGVGGTPRVR